jgi:transposase
MDLWTTIKVLRNRGFSIRQIAKQLKISSNTVRKYISTEEQPHYEKSAKYGAKSKWEDWKKEIIKMYYNKRFVGSRIFEELKKRGAGGSRTGFYTYLKKIRKEDVSKRIRERYETGSGEQAQFDWSPYTVRIGSEYRKVYIFCIMLSYSRCKYFVASFDKTQQSVFLAIEGAFWYFGGVTKSLLMDNAKQMVEEPNPRIFRWNKRYLEFLGYYGIEPDVHRIRRPFTKGKVEEPFSYLENHFIKGSEFKDFDDLLEKLKAFTEKYNSRHNKGINTTPKVGLKRRGSILVYFPNHILYR